MTQEEKQLLLKDICARLPYGVKFKADNDECIREVHYIRDEDVYVREYRNLPYWIGTIKPYLRPLSSMTEEERGELRKFCETQPQILEDIGVVGKVNSIAVIDFFNAHHFDYRGLIPMGIALEATEGMYD